MRFPIRLIPDNTNIDFVKTRWIGFGLSLAMTVATIVIILTQGLNLGIDFAGGILMEIRTPEAADLNKLRHALTVKELGEVSLQTIGDDKDVLIRIETPETEEHSRLVEHAKELLNGAVQNIDYRKIDYVGPTVGKELIESGFLALLIAMGVIQIYIWFRFEWQFGLGGVLALIHDTVLMFGFYAVTRFDFNLTSIAAILTVVGYSINDSVVIYDRIRENMRKYKKMPFADLLNKSVNDTMSRTIVTALTTLLSALALGLFGGEVIKGFGYALVFGIAIGTYSSIYISAPILIYLGIRSDTLKEEDEND